jgi:4-hydroxy-2-oxoheptanedioate aldolase
MATGAVNPLKAKLRAGQCVTCFMLTMPSVAMAQVLASSGVDCLIIDMEHGPIDLATAHAMIAATRGTSATPIVRLPWAEPWLAKAVLDAGAFGINFPMVSNAALARATVRAVRYPPQGTRGYAPSYAPIRWGLAPPDYIGIANDEILNVVTIEEPEAIARLDEILAVPGIDLVVIASFDLSMSMEVPGRFDDPELLRLVAVAEGKVRAAGLPLGGVALSAAAAEAKRAAGYRLLLLGFDVLLVDAAARDAVARATTPLPMSID